MADDRLETALATLLPVVIHDGPDYAEVTFGTARSQTMTMEPELFQALNALPALITRLRASEASTAAAVERAERAKKQCAWMDAAAKALAGYERDCGWSFDDMHELGRIEESNDSPSFRIRVGHIRAALPSTPPVAEEA